MKRTPLAYILILIAFLVNTLGAIPITQAQEFRLPTPGVMVNLSPPLEPPILKGIKIHPENPFYFDFILDKGDVLNRHPEPAQGFQHEQLKTEATKLIKYFLASLTIPEKDLWVNLSPYEKNRIIPSSFGLTEMGRDLLAEDYMLKQITATLFYPEDAIGKKFWKRIYEKSIKKFGTTNISVNTFNKVWIVPYKAVVYENAKAGTAYVVEAKLKVMLEQDYLSLQKHMLVRNGITSLGANIVREIVIPELTKEVNENKNFTQLRQVYNSLILATWYKKKIKDSILGQVYADKNKIAGVGYKKSINIEAIYQHYLQAFKKGVYNYIKEEKGPMNQDTVPRKYFSGGMFLSFDASKAMTTESNLEPTPPGGGLLEVSLFVKPTDNAMNSVEEIKAGYNHDIELLVGIKWDELNEDTRNLIQTVGIVRTKQMAEAAAPFGKNVFQRGLGQVYKILSEKEIKNYWDGLVTMVGESEYFANHLLNQRLPELRQEFTPEEFTEYWSGMVKMARVAGSTAYLYGSGISELRRSFTKEEFKRRWQDLTEMALAVGYENAGHLFQNWLPSLRAMFTAEEFELYWKEIVKMVKLAGPNSDYIFDFSFPFVRKFITPENFSKITGILVDLTKGSRPESGYPLRKNLVKNHQKFGSVEEFVEYAKKINRVMGFIDVYVDGYLSDAFDSDIFNKVIDDQGSLDNRFVFVLRMAELNSIQHKNQIMLLKLLESWSFRYADELSVQTLLALIKVYQNDENLKYFLYFVKESSKASEKVKQIANNYIFERQLFKLHDVVAQRIKTGKKNVLVIQNIKDGQGDETVRIVPMVEELLDFNPDVHITIITGRPYVYDNPRVTIIPMASINDESLGILKNTYDVVIDHYDKEMKHSHELEQAVESSGVAQRAFVYIRSFKIHFNFDFEMFKVNGQEYVSSVNANSSILDNVYSPTYRLIAELGLPLRSGEDLRKNSIINSVSYPAAQLRWQEMMRQMGNDKKIELLNKPVVLFNPYGGETEEKGFYRSYKARQDMIQLITEMVQKGLKVIILPNATSWGNKKIAEELYGLLPEEIRQNCVVAPEPTDDPRMYKYFVTYADYILTVEGGMMHLSFNLGKPFSVILKAGGGRANWLPYGRTARQKYFENTDEIAQVANQRRIEKLGKTSRVISRLLSWKDRAMLSIDEPQLTKVNAYADYMRSLVVEYSTLESQKRLELLHALGPQAKEIVGGVLNRNVEIAVIPRGSTLKGYAGEGSDVEYTICILSGGEDLKTTLTAKQERDIYTAINKLIADKGYEPESITEIGKHQMHVFNYSSIDQIFKSGTLLHFAEKSSAIFLPAVYGNRALIDKIRKEILYEIFLDTDDELWEAIRNFLNEESATAIDSRLIIEKSHLRGFFLDMHIDPKDPHSQGAINKFNLKRQIPGLNEMLDAHDLAQTSSAGLTSNNTRKILLGSAAMVTVEPIGSFKFRDENIFVANDMVRNDKINVRGQFVTMDPLEVDVRVSVEPEMVDRDLVDDPVAKRKEGAGRSIQEFVKDANTPIQKDVLMAFNGITGNYYEANSAVLLDGKLIIKGKRADGGPAKGIGQKADADYKPLNGPFWFLPFDPVLPGQNPIKKVLMKDGKLVGEKGLKNGIFGAVIIKDGKSTLTQDKDENNEYIGLGFTPALRGQDVNFTKGKREAISAMGYTTDGKLFRATLMGDPNDRSHGEENEPNIEEFVEYLIKKGVRDAIVMGTVADVKTYIKEAPEPYISAKERMGVLSKEGLLAKGLSQELVDRVFSFLKREAVLEVDSSHTKGTLNKFTNEIEGLLASEFGRDFNNVFHAIKSSCNESYLGNVFAPRSRPNGTHVVVYKKEQVENSVKSPEMIKESRFRNLINNLRAGKSLTEEELQLFGFQNNRELFDFVEHIVKERLNEDLVSFNYDKQHSSRGWQSTIYFDDRRSFAVKVAEEHTPDMKLEDTKSAFQLARLRLGGVVTPFLLNNFKIDHQDPVAGAAVLRVKPVTDNNDEYIRNHGEEFVDNFFALMQEYSHRGVFDHDFKIDSLGTNAEGKLFMLDFGLAENAWELKRTPLKNKDTFHIAIDKLHKTRDKLYEISEETGRYFEKRLFEIYGVRLFPRGRWRTSMREEDISNPLAQALREGIAKDLPPEDTLEDHFVYPFLGRDIDEFIMQSLRIRAGMASVVSKKEKLLPDSIESFLQEKLSAMQGEPVFKANDFQGIGAVIPGVSHKKLEVLYKIAQHHHQGMDSDDTAKTTYMAHILGVVAFYVNALKGVNPSAVQAGFLHDAIEDSIEYFTDESNKNDAPEKRRQDRRDANITDEQRQKVAEGIRRALIESGQFEAGEVDEIMSYVWAMTKTDRKRQEKSYYRVLIQSGEDAVLLKMADRMYNVGKTYRDPTFLERYLQETIKEFVTAPVKNNGGSLISTQSPERQARFKNYLDQRVLFAQALEHLRTQIESRLPHLSKSRIISAARGDPFDAKELIDAFNDDPLLQEQLDSDLENHIMKVLGQFEKHFSNVPRLNKSFFRILIVLHDIGKTIAKKEGDIHKQHGYTLQIINWLKSSLPLEEKEIRFLEVLLGSDSIGDLLGSYNENPRPFDKQDEAYKKAVREIKRIQQATNIPMDEFWQGLIAYQQSDSTSYTKEAGDSGRYDAQYSHGHNDELVFDEQKGRIKMNEILEPIYESLERDVKDKAELAQNLGGVDLTPANMNLEIHNAGKGIKFHMNSAMLARLRNAPGFVPVIINIQPLVDLKSFLEIKDKTAVEAPPNLS